MPRPWCAGTRRRRPGRRVDLDARRCRRRAGRRWGSGRWRPAARRPCSVVPSSSSSAIRRRRWCEPIDVVVAADVPLLGREVGEAVADRRRRSARSSRAAADDDRDAHAQRGEDVRELCGDESAADDHQVLGQFGDPHDGVAGVVVHAALGDRRRHAVREPGGDDHLVGGELVAAVGAQRVAAVGPGRPNRVWLRYTVDVGQAAPVVLAARRDRVDAAEHPRHDVAASGPRRCARRRRTARRA